MRTSPSSDTLTLQAAHWHARHREGSLSDTEHHAFMEWLVASPEHLREYLALDHVSNALGDALAGEDVDALLASPAATDEDNVVTLPLGRSAARQRSAAPVQRWRGPAWALAACVGIAAVGVAGWVTQSESTRFDAARGAPKQFALADGTTLQLDADSQVIVHFTPLQRRVDVQRGRAAFKVAEGRRPFEVQAAGLRVRDIGTTFSVSLQREQARVDVLEGRVQVRADADPRVLADLAAGQSARIAYRDHRVDLRNEAPMSMSGWWQGRIVFHDETLRDVVDQFNRRNRRQVVLEDESAAATRLSGNLRAEGVDALAAYLGAQASLDVRREGDDVRVRSRLK
ncbi:FecR domain-containing protein [Stenotrophomonas maltophilia]|uniref:FecR family protein n=1 Tax=Stenotrophomonas maltophilia TaxID=40324 RepID=UPI0019D4DEFD|nr:FecR domain-containing protein [Stenotrophomonas maltophilia]MBN7830492.1 FecR domain-containing protein [Stenotrophomonas maltophilia]MBN7833525.1 FecR domain-containing protein [Stenotrophomonas maltophilia]MBN7859595.1 FecR domain-containing protein [Stenotrophomonas maltophilia]MBN7916365.1 FecR domain-containing protein [Stenotrophomonas maltophilia]MBO2846724.1 FecR domain-containing protein [Stenotrophomonas maltophilia]